MGEDRERVSAFTKIDKKYKTRTTQRHKDMVKELYSTIREEFGPVLDGKGRFTRIPTSFILGYMFAHTGKILSRSTISYTLRNHETELLNLEMRPKDDTTEMEKLKAQITSMQAEMREMMNELTKPKKQESMQGDIFDHRSPDNDRH
jgi:hypothetical protein